MIQAYAFFSTWLAFALRLEQLILLKNFNIYASLISIMIALPVFWLFGLYRTILRYTNLSIIKTILTSTFVYGLIYFLVVGVYGLKGVPRSIGIIQPMILFFWILGARLGVKLIFNFNFDRHNTSKKNKRASLWRW